MRACALLAALSPVLAGCGTVPVGVVGLTLQGGRPVVLVHACHEQITGAVLLDENDVVLARGTVDGPYDGKWVLPVGLLPARGARIGPLYGDAVVGPAMPVSPGDLTRLRQGVVRFSENVDPRPNATATVEDDKDGFRDRACDAAQGFLSGQPGITATFPATPAPASP